MATTDRMVGESYKDFAGRMAGQARAAEIDRDRARAEVDQAYARGHADGMAAGRRVAWAEAQDEARQAMHEGYQLGLDAGRGDNS